MSDTLNSVKPQKNIPVSGYKEIPIMEVPTVKKTVTPYITILPTQTDFIQNISVSFRYETSYDVWYSIDGGTFTLYTTPFNLYSINEDVPISFVVKSKSGIALTPIQTQLYHFDQLSFQDGTTGDKKLILMENGQLILYDLASDYNIDTTNKTINGTNYVGQPASFRLSLNNGILLYEEITYSSLYLTSIILLDITPTTYYQLTINNGIVEITNISDPNTI
jgi:hypothetical protein